MWNRLSLRIKITVITAAVLTLMCAGLAAAAILSTSVFDPVVKAIDDKSFFGSDLAVIKEIEKEKDTVLPDDPGASIQVEDLYAASRYKFKLISVLTALGLIIFGAFATWFLTGKTLKPLQTFTDRVEETDENNLNGQVVLPPGSSEVSRLTHSFNNMLEKLERAFANKKLFASNAAHELKTPLTNILTNIEVMQMDAEPGIEDYREVIDVTKENAERLTALIQELLYFNAELDKDNFDSFKTDCFFEKIINDLTTVISEKNIEVITEGCTALTGDKALLERAFFNLIQNAAKYNKENGKIHITARGDTITIEDTGIGIPADSITQIFEPFYCVDKSRSRKLGGSGLGLGIAKQIFDKHNMKISVSSEPGKGTKIFIKIF